jgi:hypothetical protein
LGWLSVGGRSERLLLTFGDATRIEPMHIHSRALKYFDMIRRCGSIRAAARQLHVSSSAVNRQLRQLEDEVDWPLLERLPRGLRLRGSAAARWTWSRSRRSPRRSCRQCSRR